MAAVDIREARSPAELEQALAIRCAVFVAEQGVALTLEIDGRDRAARHLLALRSGEPVGTCVCAGWMTAGPPRSSGSRCSLGRAGRRSVKR
jgi:predicted GNAT family N-acyltransferase